MERFIKTKVVRLLSHHGKFLVADDEGESVRLKGRNCGSRNAKWIVEVQTRDNTVRLKSMSGKYLTASAEPFLLGLTGKKVIQTTSDTPDDCKMEWEVVRDGFQVKLKSWCGKFLRANSVTIPWKNSVTHDEPRTGETSKWVLWEVEPVAVGDTSETLGEYLSFVSCVSSVSEDVIEAVSDGPSRTDSEPGSPMTEASSPASTPRKPFIVLKFSSARLVPTKRNTLRIIDSAFGSQSRSSLTMDFFHNAKAVRLRSHHDKYLHADDDEESVFQDRNGSSKCARWTVELVPGTNNIIRLKSCYGRYLTASNQPFLLGMTGRKVTQTLPSRLDSSLEWEPVREGNVIKLKTRYGNFLRANGGVPPWRNSVTHDIPTRSATQDWILWSVDVVEIQVLHSPVAAHPPPLGHQDSLNFDPASPTTDSAQTDQFSRQESIDSPVDFPPKLEGRTIYYHVAEANGDVPDDVIEPRSLLFKGNAVGELISKLMEETGLDDIVVCTRSPTNGKLYPLRLHLPPNNSDMQVVVVSASSKAAREFAAVRL